VPGPPPPLAADYFVDPLCSWSWGNEPRIRRFLSEFGPAVALTRRTGGLFEHRDAGFHDPQYDLSGDDPAAIAAHQAEVASETGMPIDPRVWSICPPASSHPACLAVHAAALQDAALRDPAFRRIQEGFFTRRLPVDRPEALIALLAGLTGLDLHRFARALVDEPTQAAFRADWEAARDPVPEARDVKETEGHQRYAFPTLVLTNAAGERRVLDGGHPYAAYRDAIEALAPGVVPAPAPDVGAFLARWGSAAPREVAEGCGLSDAAAEAALRDLEAKGEAERRQVGEPGAPGSGSLWRHADGA
jgi:putative protein-disulfide isomerase